MKSLHDVAANWHPKPRSVLRTAHPEPITGFSDLTNHKVDATMGAVVPALWHWFAFAESCPQTALGEDGHPLDGPFLPPFSERRRMMAGGRFEQERPLRVGGTYRRDSEVGMVRVTHGKSGDLLFVTTRHRYFETTSNTFAAVEEEDVVYRHQTAGTERGAALDTGSSGPAWHSPLETDAQQIYALDERSLFRFSALTYNAHRIHYDQAYTTGVERYPSLVIHGPLLALLMLEAPRQQGTMVSSFAYRLRRPAFLGSPLVVTSNNDELAIGSASASTPSATAQYTPRLVA